MENEKINTVMALIDRAEYEICQCDESERLSVAQHYLTEAAYILNEYLNGKMPTQTTIKNIEEIYRDSYKIREVVNNDFRCDGCGEKDVDLHKRNGKKFEFVVCLTSVDDFDFDWDVLSCGVCKWTIDNPFKKGARKEVLWKLK